MTLAETIYQRSLKLPDAAAQEAVDFIEFLNQRYGLAEATTPVDNAADGDATAYDAWFKAQVQQAIDDPRPGIHATNDLGSVINRRIALVVSGSVAAALSRSQYPLAAENPTNA